MVKNGSRKYDWSQQLWVALELLEIRMTTKIDSLAAWCVLRSRGCRTIGKRLRVRGRLHVFTRRNDSISIGDHVLMVSRFRSNPVGITNPCVLDTLKGGTISIGNHVGMSGAVLSSKESIVIGDHVKLGANVRIFDHNYHSLNWENRRDGVRDAADVRSAPVVVGQDVFIGTNSIILKGVSIGDRAIIAAGSVVSCDIPPDEIWGGNPAKCLRPAK
jgi:acetyltransferase-like isoleucine patch superfamily enzyme